MKYIFETEDEEEARHLLNGCNYRIFLFDLEQKIRSHIHHDTTLSVEEIYDDIAVFNAENPLS